MVHGVFSFNGRSTRLAYFFSSLLLLPSLALVVVALVYLALGVLTVIDDVMNSTHTLEASGFLMLLAAVLLFLGIGVPVFVASLATNVRRLHDLGVSAWGLLWQLIPIVGLVMWVGLQFVPGDALPNRYGDAPKAMSYRAPRGYDAAPD